MARTDLWKYCSAEQCREMMLSFRLVGAGDWPPEKIMGCLYALSNHAEKHYQRVNIPKRSGGFRTLLVPDPLLKNVQRNLLHHVLDGFTVSDSAAAYRKGASVAANAGKHQGRMIVMKMDIEDFFGSITFPMVLHHAFPAAYFPPAVGVMLASLCCCHDRLPQGAPTSPAISNLVMKPFDEYMEAWCGEREIVYSRYCDDMTFSGVFEGSEVKGKLYGFLRRRLRQEIYSCMKYGAKEHLTRTGRQAYLNDGDGGTRRYLESLLGKTAYVLLASGNGDAWFREAQMKLREMLGQDMCL